MTTISSVDRLLQVVQTQAADAQQRTNAALNEHQASSLRSAPMEVPENIDAWVTAQIKAIERDDPQRRRRAFRAFLKGEILKRLEGHLTIGPSLDLLTDKSLSAMETDADLRQAINEAADLLLSQGGTLSRSPRSPD